MKKVRIIDTHSCSHFHEMFNSAFLVKLVYSLNISSVEYLSDLSSWKNILKIIADNNLENILEKVSYSPITVFSRKWNSLSLLMRNILGAIKNIYYYINSEEGTIIIYSINNPLSLHLLNILSKKNKSKSIRVICHGEMELLIKNYSRLQPSFWYKYILNKFLKKSNIAPNFKFIILGKHIEEHLLRMYTNCNDHNFVIMDHPYIISDYPALVHTNKDARCIEFGTIGAVSENKGFKDLLSLACNFNKEIKNNVLRISVIGPHPLNIDEYPLLNIVSKDGGALQTDKYIKSVQELDYILFFYKSPTYTLTASGAIFDAIKQNKFIISLKNDYFEYIFKTVGPIGYLVNSVENMENIIKALLIDGDPNTTIFYENLKKARSYFDAKSSNQKLEI